MKTKPINEPIPDKIKNYRKVNKLTQAQLGERLGIDDSYVSHIEAGRSIASNILIKLVKVTGGYISLDDIVSYKGTEP
jgi:transcriptional regulator with XRE-family HTH domain